MPLKIILMFCNYSTKISCLFFILYKKYYNFNNYKPKVQESYENKIAIIMYFKGKCVSRKFELYRKKNNFKVQPLFLAALNLRPKLRSQKLIYFHCRQSLSFPPLFHKVTRCCYLESTSVSLTENR